MKFELIGKTKATLVDVDVQSLKKGQTEVVPAVALTFKVPLANHFLNLLDPRWLPFLYEKGNGSGQAALEGVSVVSEIPALTAVAMGLKKTTLSWEGEQTGSKLHIYLGVSGSTDIKLKDGTVDIKKFDPHEGGAVDFFVRFYASDLDAETIGELAVLKSHELDIELTAPEIVTKQKEIKLPPPKAETQARVGEENPFPIKGDAPGTGAAEGLQTPESAFAAAVTAGAADPATAPKVTTRRPSRLATVK